MLRKLVVVSMLMLIVAVLSGCTYTFDFAAEGDLTNTSGTWEQLTGTVTEFSTEDGAYLPYNTIKAPVAFTGDYTVEYYFKPVYSGGNAVDMVFSLRGESGNYAGIRIMGFDLATSYRIEWGLPDDFAGSNLNPFIENMADNVLRITKTGNHVDYVMGDSDFIGTINLPVGLETDYWAPEILGYYLGHTFHDGIFLKKVRVIYNYGNMMER